MKLIDLLNTFDSAMPFAITYKGETYKYTDGLELYDDCVFYDEIRDKLVTLIWYSKALYNCIVIEIE